MKNILCGMQAHTCSFPCVNCKSRQLKVPVNSLNYLGEERTLASLAHDYESFVAAGCPYKRAQEFFSVTEQPLLLETLDEMKSSSLLVMDALPPSQLHIELRVVNHVYSFLIHFDNGVWKEIVEGWAKKTLCKRELWHGGEFQGNQCKALLENLSYFEDNFGNAKIPLMAPFLVALKSFNEIRKKCFKATGPEPGWQESIQRFKDSYFELNTDFGLSITPVVHDVCFHLQPFMEKYPEVFLGLVTEQTGESIHRVWVEFVQNRLITSQDHPDYPDKLLSALVAFNSQRI